jgi:hypothetical protein
MIGAGLRISNVCNAACVHASLWMKKDDRSPVTNMKGHGSILLYKTGQSIRYRTRHDTVSFRNQPLDPSGKIYAIKASLTFPGGFHLKMF